MNGVEGGAFESGEFSIIKQSTAARTVASRDENSSRKERPPLNQRCYYAKQALSIVSTVVVPFIHVKKALAICVRPHIATFIRSA